MYMQFPDTLYSYDENQTRMFAKNYSNICKSNDFTISFKRNEIPIDTVNNIGPGMSAIFRTYYFCLNSSSQNYTSIIIIVLLGRQ